MVLVLGISSDEVSWKYLKGFLSFCLDTKSWQTDRQMDRQMDGQGDYYRASANFVWRGPHKMYLLSNFRHHLDLVSTHSDSDKGNCTSN